MATEHSFTDQDSSKNKKRVYSEVCPIESVLTDSRKLDDALLQALSLVLSSNSEYARSIHALLDNDLDKEQAITKLDTKVVDLLTSTEKLIISQDNLSIILKSINDEYRDVVELAVLDSNSNQQTYMDAKFAALFVNLGLKSDGTAYSPMDNFIVKIKTIFTNQFWVFVVCLIMYHIALGMVKKYFGGV